MNPEYSIFYTASPVLFNDNRHTYEVLFDYDQYMDHSFVSVGLKVKIVS